MKNYVLGFLFNATMDEVVLIRKVKPAWQAGKLNGVGGEIKPYEIPLDAMRREWKEETGTGFTSWSEFCYLYAPDVCVVCYAGRDTYSMDENSAFCLARTTTREKVDRFPLRELCTQVRMLNLDWLIPMAKEDLRTKNITVRVIYGDERNLQSNC